MIAKIEQEEQLLQLFILLLQGVQIFRVHNVNEIKQGILDFKKFYQVNEK